MNKIITVYELLGLIKDGKAPKKIEYNDLECIYDDDYKNYYIPDCVEYLIDGMNIVDDLNNKVEIIEEDKPIIEKLDVALLSQSDNWLWCPSKDEFSKDIELNSYIIQNIRENTLCFQRKINEVIDYINRKEDK